MSACLSSTVNQFVEACASLLVGEGSAAFESSARRAARRPLDPLPLYDLANLCRDRGRRDLWLQAVGLALSLDHPTYEQTLHRAFAKLTLGDWEGWKDFDARQFAPTSHRSEYSRRLRWSRSAWDGLEDEQESVLLVVHEQGFGDTIQMLRFVPALTSRARRVILVIQPELVDFVHSNLGHIIDVRPRGPDFPAECDRYVRMMSLPGIIGKLPPFTALSAPRSAWSRTRPDSRIRAGICWAGSPDHANDERRSIPIAACKPLLSRDDVSWYSLQVGSREQEAKLCATLLLPSPELRSFADTACCIATLDCVVTVDTAVCHLAGALGIPTYLMLPYASEWRWGLGDTTPWYPSMQLVRQCQPGAWDAVVHALMSRIDSLAAVASLQR